MADIQNNAFKRVGFVIGASRDQRKNAYVMQEMETWRALSASTYFTV